MASIFLRCHTGGDESDCTCQEVSEDSIIPRRPKLEELAESPISEELRCPLCREVLDNAVTAVCGDSFCLDCLVDASASKDATCPQCLEPLESGSMPVCRMARKLLAVTRVRCENSLSFDLSLSRFTPSSLHPLGCPALVAFQDYPAHLEICSYALLACPYQLAGCQLAVERASYDSHCQQCEYRPEICQCGQEISPAQREEHSSVCTAGDDPCPHAQFGCIFRGGRAKVVEHLVICPYEMVKMALYRPEAKKAVDDCLAAVKTEAANVKWNHLGEEEDLEKAFEHMKEGALYKFDDLTRNVPEQLRIEAKENLREALEALDLLPSSPSSNSFPQRTTSYPTSASKESDKTLFTLEDVSLATNNFSQANLLGKGGFGSVYQGMHYGTPVAVKRLHQGGNAQEFEFEVSILQRIRHPHVVLLMGCNPDAMCIVSEFLPGGSLDERLKGKGQPLPWTDRLRICAEMSAALLYLHRNGILHRDLKPANVLLDKNNHCKLADMGLAKLFKDTIMSLPKGTFGYIDPYQLQTGQLSRSSDVYALGLIILQLLTGQRRIQLIHQILGNCQSLALNRDLDNATNIFLEHLDDLAGNWNLEITRSVLRIAIQCVERTKYARPDLQTEVQPKLFLAAEAAKNCEGQIQESKNVNTPPRTTVSPSKSRLSSPRISELEGHNSLMQGSNGGFGSRKPSNTWNETPGNINENDMVRNVRRMPVEKFPVREEQRTVSMHNYSNPIISSEFTNSIPQAPPPNELWITNRERMMKSRGGVTETDIEQQPTKQKDMLQVQALRRQADEQYGRGEYLRAHHTYQHALSLLPSGHPECAPLHIGCAECVISACGLSYAGCAVQVVKETTDAISSLSLSLPPSLSPPPSARSPSPSPSPPRGLSSSPRTGDGGGFLDSLQGEREREREREERGVRVGALLMRAQAYSRLGNWRLAQGDVETILRVASNHEQALELKNRLQEEFFRVTNGVPPPPSLLDEGDSFMEPMEMGGVHFGESCQSCGMSPICGLLYRSIRRRGQVFCQRCMEEQAAHPEEFQDVPPPEHSNAQFLHSLGYSHGICLIRSKRDTLSLLKKASHRGHPLAKTALGQLYLKGEGIPQDQELATRWLSLGATLPEEQFTIGKTYLTGTLTLNGTLNNGTVTNNGTVSVAKNPMEAVRMLKLAAMHGHVGALKELATCYRKGRGGVGVDMEEEGRLLRAAAVEAGKAKMKAGR